MVAFHSHVQFAPTENRRNATVSRFMNMSIQVYNEKNCTRKKQERNRKHISDSDENFQIQMNINVCVMFSIIGAARQDVFAAAPQQNGVFILRDKGA